MVGGRTAAAACPWRHCHRSRTRGFEPIVQTSWSRWCFVEEAVSFIPELMRFAVELLQLPSILRCGGYWPPPKQSTAVASLPHQHSRNIPISSTTTPQLANLPPHLQKTSAPCLVPPWQRCSSSSASGMMRALTELLSQESGLGTSPFAVSYYRAL